MLPILQISADTDIENDYRSNTRDVNRCSSSPCRNGGQCTAFSKFFVCSCAQGFGGTTCEVTGADNQVPVISNCPTQGVTVTANAGDDFAFVTWPDLIVNDNSGHVNLVSSNGAPGNYAVGSRNVRYVYADASGLSATCSFVVTVNEVVGNPTVEVSLDELPGGVFQLDSYPGQYADNEDMSFIVRSNNPNLVLQMTFLVLDLRAGDILQIGSGSVIGNNVLGTFNGDRAPPAQPLTSTSNFAWCRFTSNSDGLSGTGFIFRIWKIQSRNVECFEVGVYVMIGL
ncbi:hypothetical protein BSL78_17363 [Apostichopus japonicus]|uniref:Uncharacterized protein n=1 Tax=Stichopus japonicus TaxID=307972 RepID=A0A2G8KCR6_STIJA|nr:hypothetical protein BSL78_17363 [Apostichopus japonicus]